MYFFLIIGYFISIFYILYQAIKRRKEPRIAFFAIYFLLSSVLVGYMMSLTFRGWEWKYLFMGISTFLLVAYIIYFVTTKMKR